MMSSVEDDYSPIASRVGADLRTARERVGWTLPAIAAHLRIRLMFLEAIEEGRISDLPGNAYAVGFLRTYAQALGLDPDEIARRFKAEAADVNRKTELAFPAPVPERGVPAGAVVLVGVVIAIGAYIGWYRMSGTDRPATEMVQPVPERLAPLAATAAPAPPPVPAQPASPAPAPSTSTLANASAGSSSAPVPLPGSASSGGLANGHMAGPPLPSSLAAPAGSAAGQGPAVASLPAPNVPMPPGAAQSPVVPVSADGTRVVLRAKADAWVQVREKQGQVLLNRVMRSGETWPVPANKQPPLLLTTGNAGGTELLVDGAATPSLGADGAVRRDLPLDPDMIRDGKLTPPGSGCQAGNCDGDAVQLVTLR